MSYRINCTKLRTGVVGSLVPGTGAVGSLVPDEVPTDTPFEVLAAEDAPRPGHLPSGELEDRHESTSEPDGVDSAAPRTVA